MTDNQPGPERIFPRRIEDEMRESYLDYSMSVIVGRALPDVRDGLKPVHRRILYSMNELGLAHNKPYKKSARVTGDCLGKFHPHGDMAVYDSMVRMVQDFSLRYPLLDGQGNFGCFTGDTKVQLTDGRCVNFKNLICEADQGKKNYAFTLNHKTGSVEITEILAPGLTRKKAALVKVVIDTGEEIKCTPDHRFMLRDGTYKQAKALQPGDSLMPLYTQLHDGKADKNLKGYTMVYQPFKECWDFVHRLADEWNLRNGVPSVENATRYFGSFEQMIESAQFQLNHKVVAVEPLNKREDVYDITTEPWHNFSLSAGVFVHNSVDGDSPAAMRYTEVRLGRIADEMLGDLEKNTVDFMPNFDESLQEPRILPAKLPNLLVNGSSGIAVGMATNVPPHNLTEVADGIIQYIDNPDLTVDELVKTIKGPDFPTGGIVHGKKGIKNYFSTGRGSIQVRAVADVEEMKGGRKAIIVTELPYQVNKSTLLENIAHLVNSKQIENISDIRDESDRKGMRIVLELKRDANEELVMNQLYKHTNLQVTFGVICLALVNNIPKILSMPEQLHYYVEHRKEIVTRRTKFELARAEERAHIVEGLRIALENLDQVVKTIKQSKDRPQAFAALVKKFKLTEKQGNAILDMRLHQLTGLERKNLEDEYLELIKTIEKLRYILGCPSKILEIIKKEVTELKERYGDNRRTKIQAHTIEYEEEDLIPNTEVVVSISHNGYIKRQTLDSYRAQLRGGRGIRGTSLGEGDFVEDLFITTNHCYVLFFTSYGRVHWKKVYQIPEASRQAKGRAIANLLSLQPEEKVSALFSIRDLDEPDRYLLMVTEKGMVKKTALLEYSNPRHGGIIAIRLKKEDHLVDVKLTDGNGDVFIATQRGMAIHFSEEDVRTIGRASQGVRGIRLEKGDRVIGCEVVTKGWTVLTVTEKGMGKRTDVSKYRLQGRGGKGVTNQKITAKTGNVVVVRAVRPEDEILVITAKGVVNRQTIKGISVIGRATQGVRVVRLDAGDKVVSVGRIAAEEVSEESK